MPLGWFARTATQDTQVGQASVKAGERVLVMYAGANRDPKHFPDPHAFRLDRPVQPLHVGYGWGSHRCAGMALAALELKVAVEEVLARSSRLTLRQPIERTASSEARHIWCSFDQ